MNKKDLIKRTAEDMNVSQAKAKVMVDTVLNNIEMGLRETGRVDLTGFFRLIKKERAARRCKLNEKEIVTPAKVVTFCKLGSRLK